MRSRLFSLNTQYNRELYYPIFMKATCDDKTKDRITKQQKKNKKWQAIKSAFVEERQHVLVNNTINEMNGNARRSALGSFSGCINETGGTFIRIFCLMNLAAYSKWPQ